MPTRRDWPAVGRAKARYWVERKRRLGPAEGIRIGDELRRQVLAVRPDWPDAAERAADLERHIRVAACLRRVPPRR
jgi:hypothetical protein